MTLQERGRNAWRFLRGLYREFNKDHGPLVSAAMSFYALLSTVPLLIVAVAALAYILPSQEEAYKAVFDYVGGFFPGMKPNPLEAIVRGRGPATALGLLALLWAGSQFFVSLENAVNIAWNVEDRRGFVRKRLVALEMVLVAGLLLVINLGVTTLIGVVRGLRNVPGIDSLLQASWFWTDAAFLFTLVTTVAMFVMIYKFLPNCKVKWRDALWGAIAAGALWEIAKQAFSWYVPKLFAKYNSIYGPLAGIVILMVWIYYSSMVTIIGAEIAALRAQLRERART